MLNFALVGDAMNRVCTMGLVNNIDSRIPAFSHFLLKH